MPCILESKYAHIIFLMHNQVSAKHARKCKIGRGKCVVKLNIYWQLMKTLQSYPSECYLTSKESKLSTRLPRPASGWQGAAWSRCYQAIKDHRSLTWRKWLFWNLENIVFIDVDVVMLRVCWDEGKKPACLGSFSSIAQERRIIVYNL